MRNRIDEVIAYWNRQPCNVNHSRSEIGTKKYFDEVEERKYFVEPHIKRFAQFERWRGKKVLEIGCGIGTDAINFRRAGAIYRGIDVSQSSVDLANKRFELEGFEPACEVWDAEKFLPMTEAGWDLIYSFGVLHHTPAPKEIVFWAHRAINRKSGEFRFMVYARYSWKYMMIQEGLDQYEAQEKCPIANVFDQGSINTLLNNYFYQASREQTHIFPYVVEKYKNHEYELEPHFATMDERIFEMLEHNLGWHLLIVAKPL